MNGKHLSAALRAGERVYGTAIYSTSPRWPDVVKNLGLDLVFIDAEHGPHDRSMLAWMCTSYAALNLAPIVRIPEPDPYQAAMMLDGGASGVIVPYVESVEQVKALAGAVKYSPLKGDRLKAFLDGEALEPELEAYLVQRNANHVLMINIESVPAMQRLDEILSLPYVDAVLVGPHDLSCSLGVPEQWEHPKQEQAIHQIIASARAHDKGVGIHHSFMHQEIAWAKAGANLIMHSSDISAFNRALTQEFKQIREAIQDEGAITDENVHF
ncbi:MAG: aldolase/citrate lyase family protein [Chloroflexota bacterium]